MKNKNLAIIWIIGFILIGIVSAILSISSFDGISDGGNLSFTTNQNINKNLSINKYANITSASLNLTGELGFCFQESANTTNQTNLDGNCGLNYSGNYIIEGTNFGTGINASAFFDGNYSTAIGTLDYANFYINYSIPSGALNGSLWQVKDTSLQTYTNLSIDECLINGVLQLRFLSAYNGGASNANSSWSCYNGSAWAVKRNNTGIFKQVAYEEAIFWNVLTTNLSLKIGSLSNYSWYLPQASYQGTNAILNCLNDSFTTENLTFTGNQNQTVYLDIPKIARIINASLNLTGNTSSPNIFGNGSDGNLIFTTTTKSYGNLASGTDYNVSGNTLYLNLNKEYNFINFTLGAGTILTANQTNGTGLFIKIKDTANISGTINLSNILQYGNFTSNFTFNNEIISISGVKQGGVGGGASSNYYSSAISGFGGAGGEIPTGICSFTINVVKGADGGFPFGSGGSGTSCGSGILQQANVGTASGGTGGGCAKCSGAGSASGGAGGSSYGANGADGSGTGTSWAGIGGSGAGGIAGKSGIHLYLDSQNVILTGTIDLSGTAGGNGGNGGRTWVNDGSNTYDFGLSPAGGGGGGGNSGNIRIIYSNLVDSSSKILNGGSGGTAGGSSYGASAGTSGTSGIFAFDNMNATSNIYLDVLIDNAIEYNYTEYYFLNNNIDLNVTSINSYLSTCTADNNGICQVPLLFHSDTSGILQISNISINYTNISKTLDFSSKLNSALSSGSCSGGTLSGNSCIIPFLFHSDTSGILQYSNLEINYTEIPRVILESPVNDSVSGINKTFNCNGSSSEFALINSTLNIWNSTNSLINSTTEDITGESNLSSINITFSVSDTYHWNCLVCNNDSTCSFASQNNTLKVDVTNPIINQYPSNNYWSNNTNDNIFNCSIANGGTLDTVFFYLNNILNETKEAIDGINTFTKNLSDGNYNWTCAVNKTSGDKTFAQQGNFSYGVDTITPIANNLSIVTTTNSNQFNFTSNITDTNLNTCWYSISGFSPMVNTTFSCNVETVANAVGFGTYNLFVWANDSAGNTINQNLSFTTSISDGGTTTGGGSTVIISEQGRWTMEVTTSNAKYEVNMISGTSRDLSIQFENLGSSSKRITLSCNDITGSICKYVTFKENPFTLALLKNTKQRQTFTINLPETLENEDYKFNIRATDDSQRTGDISVSLSVGGGNILTSFIIKISSSTQSGFPYLLIFFPVLVVAIILSSILLKKVPLRPVWVIIISVGLGILSISII